MAMDSSFARHPSGLVTAPWSAERSAAQRVIKVRAETPVVVTATASWVAKSPQRRPHPRVNSPSRFVTLEVVRMTCPGDSSRRVTAASPIVCQCSCRSAAPDTGGCSRSFVPSHVTHSAESPIVSRSAPTSSNCFQNRRMNCQNNHFCRWRVSSNAAEYLYSVDIWQPDV